MKSKPTLQSLKKYLFIISLTTVLFSCGTKQDVVYFQDVDVVGSSKAINNYNSTIHPDDLMTIVVSALDQDAARPFNLTTVSYTSQTGQVGQRSQQTYLVDAEGNIDFPVLGKLKLKGLNRIQATNLIKDLLKEYIKDPIVNIRIINFKITVLGEVNRPGSYTIPNERITIIEALGLAGDLTIQAERHNVLIIREENGKKTYNRIDMTSEEVFNSSMYYLTQNDVIYVEPNNSRVKSSSVGPNVSATLSVIGVLLTSVALVVSITNVR